MAFESNKFSVAKKINLPSSDFSIECNVSLGSEIGKILSIGVKAYDENYETLNGVLNYSGVVDLKIIFMTSDGEINSTCHSCNFSSKFESNEIMTGQEAVISLKVVDYSIESISNEDIRIIVNLNQSGICLGENEVNSIGSADEDVCCKNEEIEIIKLVGSKKESFDVESEVNLRENIKKILATESQVLQKNIESATGFVSLQGEVLTRVLYLTDEDKFDSFYVNEPFKEEIEVDGAEKDFIAEAYLSIKESDVSTQIENDEKGQKLTIKVPVCANIKVFKNELVTVIEDLYSTKNEINITTESFENSVTCPSAMIEDKIEGSLTLEEDAPRVDKVLFASGNSVNLTNVYSQDGQIFVEGIAKTNVVYLNDETNSLNSVQVDVPFSFSDKFDCECEGILVATAVVSDVDVIVKKGRDLYYDAKIKVNLNCYYNKVAGIISEASMTEPLPERDYAMEVVFASSGENAWNIAKSTHVPVEQVTLQNPDLIFPLEQDSSIVLYYQKG